MIRSETKIAILMAVYNGEKYLEEQLESILSQTFQDWTLYIRDDKSTDASLEIIKRYTNRYSNICLMEDDLGNIGAKNSFFKLLYEIESPYYMFCDQDDVWLPFKIECSYNRLIKEESDQIEVKPLLLCTDVSVTDKNLFIISRSQWNLTKLNVKHFNSYMFMLISPSILGMTMCFNKSVRNVAFPINTYIGMHDSWIAYIVSKYGKVIPLAKQTVLYRQHGKNVCGVESKTKLKLRYKIFHPQKSILSNWKKYNHIKRIERISFIKYCFYKLIICIQRIQYLER